jgi:DNA-binding PadR family transcriptional regulator
MSLTLTEAKIRLLEELEGNPKHGYILAKDLGVRGSTIYEHLSQLDEHRYIKSEKNGRRRVYSLTRKGELILEAERTDE